MLLQKKFYDWKGWGYEKRSAFIRRGSLQRV